MALNVEQITSRLAQMPDAALQKYAAMNKNDPYIMALAVSESNRRKQMRQAAQAQQGQMQQPKVVDAAVQSMAQPMPEDTGIARLPAGDMNFADGGIVAFADGGEVERYSGKFGSLTGDTYADTLGFGVSPETLMLDESRRQELLRRRKAAEDAERLQFLETAAPETAARLKAEQQPKPTTPTAQDLAQFDAATNLYMTERANRQAAPKADATRRVPGAPKAPATTPATTPAASEEPTGIDALSAKLARDTELAQGALRNLRVGQAQQLVQTAEQDKAEGERMRAARGDVFAAREARLAEREKGVAKMKDQNLGLALLQAGAAMMSTPGNIGMALGKGVQVGSERYIAGIDKINAAKEKFAEARDRIDDLRLNRDDMNEREIRAENRAIRNAQLQGQQLFLDGATNDLKISNENQRAIFNVAAESLMTDRRIQGQKDVAKITAQPAIERNALLRLAQSKDDKVRTEYGKLQAKVMEDLRKDNNYTMATPAQQQVMQTNALRQALMNNPFLSAYAANVGFSSTPTGGKVYDLTEP